VNRLIIVCMLLAGVLLALVGCRGPLGLGSPTATATTSLLVVTLTASQPTGRIALQRAPDATVVRLDVQAITNPDGQGLALAAAVEATSPARHADIGSISPYPSSQPGTFTLALPGPAADLVHQGSTVLIVTVSPVLSGTTLQPDVQVRLTAELTRP
jgi:hypothetical protein